MRLIQTNRTRIFLEERVKYSEPSRLSRPR